MHRLATIAVAMGVFLLTSILSSMPLADSVNQRVSLRTFPYPYRAMLAIDSDADHQDLRKFNIIHAFLDSTARTSLGMGLGLDISDSFFLYDGSNEPDQIDYNGATVRDEMSLFKGVSDQPSVDAPILLDYIRHGWIDTFHSAGDFSRVDVDTTLFQRALEVRALHFLAQQHVPIIRDFTDHGNQSNVANFGSDTPFDAYMQGATPGSPYCIEGLLAREGVRFVWADHYDSQYVYASMLYPIRLPNGRSIWGFHRFTGTRRIVHVRQYACADWTNLWNPSQLFEQLAPWRLDALIRRGGYTIIATHLEGNANRQPLNDQTIAALRHLAALQRQGRILVASTPRLLLYNLVRVGVRYDVLRTDGRVIIDIRQVVDPVDGNFIPTVADVRGLTWDVPYPQRALIEIAGHPVPPQDVVRGPFTVGVAWYRADTKDWAVWPGTPAYRQLLRQMRANETQGTVRD